ncbi:MAG: KH domain-containing protein, partial [Clostridiales bacterium]|nr:KH domain-containing protein [Clostridiales bacterium]
MRDLVKFLVKELADADDVDVVEIEKNGGAVDMDIYVGKADIGKIIGRQGRIAKALRAVVKAAAAK